MQMILESPLLSPDMPITATMNRMTRLLKTVRPGSDADALRMLRAAFPQAREIPGVVDTKTAAAAPAPAR